MPLAEQITFIGDQAEAVPGINGLNAFGHTPGHMAYLIESEGKQLPIRGDAANNYVIRCGARTGTSASMPTRRPPR